MYESYFGLNERPFDLTPNPRYLFFTRNHEEALSHLQHGISQRKGVTVVLGPAGTGKTTLIRAALAHYPETASFVSLNNPKMTRDEFVQTVARGFDLSADAGRSKASMLDELNARLRQRLADGVVTALIVDEAQALPVDLLEEIRLLVNMETETEKLLPVVLVGQPEFGDRLNEPQFAALKQRVALRCALMPLTAAETAQYIATRVRVAGGNPGHLFTREAVDLIHERSGGIPRVVSVLCDNALLSGFALSERPVSRRVVLEVCDDFDLAGASRDAPPERAGQRRTEEVPVVPVVPVVPAGPVDAQPDAVPRARSERGLFSMFGTLRS